MNEPLTAIGEKNAQYASDLTKGQIVAIGKRNSARNTNDPEQLELLILNGLSNFDQLYGVLNPITSPQFYNHHQKVELQKAINESNMYAFFMRPEGLVYNSVYTLKRALKEEQ